MAADALLSYGARFYRSADNVTYTELADMLKIGSPGNPQAPDVDVTPLTPTAAYREFKAGLLNSGECDVEQHFNKTRFTLLRGLLRTTTYWRVIFPDNATPANASKVEFQGFVKEVTTSDMGNPDDVIKIMAKIKITGAITFTEGS